MTDSPKTADTGFWSGRPTLVTGASGLLGRWLMSHLLEQDARVVCLARPGTGAHSGPTSFLPGLGSSLRNGISVVEADLTTREDIEHLLHSHEIDTVFHLAAQTIVGIANADPSATFDTNIRGSWTVLEACRRTAHVRQIVFASSDKAYGDSVRLPYTEDTPLQGRHPYDVSKSCADLLAQTYAHTYRLPVIIARCGNFYGGGDLNWSRIVPGTIRSVVQGERPSLRSDGNFIRDFLYVEDGARAHSMLAEKLSIDRSLAGQAFNFSNEDKMTVIELVRKILRLMESDLEPQILNEARGEIHCQYLSAERARRQFGWRPTFTLEEGLQRTIAWYRAFLSRESAP